MGLRLKKNRNSTKKTKKEKFQFSSEKYNLKTWLKTRDYTAQLTTHN